MNFVIWSRIQRFGTVVFSVTIMIRKHLVKIVPFEIYSASAPLSLQDDFSKITWLNCECRYFVPRLISFVLWPKNMDVQHQCCVIIFCLYLCKTFVKILGILRKVHGKSMILTLGIYKQYQHSKQD